MLAHQFLQRPCLLVCQRFLLQQRLLLLRQGQGPRRLIARVQDDVDAGRSDHGLGDIPRMLQRHRGLEEAVVPQLGIGMDQVARVLGRNARVVGIQRHLAFKALSVLKRLIDGVRLRLHGLACGVKQGLPCVLADRRRAGLQSGKPVCDILGQRHHDVLDAPVALRYIIGNSAIHENLLLKQRDVPLIALPADGDVLPLIVRECLPLVKGDLAAVQIQHPPVFQLQLQLLTVSLLCAAHIRQERVDHPVGCIGRFLADERSHLLPDRFVGLPGLLIQQALRLLVDLRLSRLAQQVFQHAQTNEVLEHAVCQLLLLRVIQAHARCLVELGARGQGVLHRLQVIGNVAYPDGGVRLLCHRAAAGAAQHQQAAKQRSPYPFPHS